MNGGEQTWVIKKNCNDHNGFVLFVLVPHLIFILFGIIMCCIDNSVHYSDHCLESLIRSQMGSILDFSIFWPTRKILKKIDKFY